MSRIRVQRVRELLKRTIGEIIRRDYPPGDLGLITVSDLDISRDLQLATVYVGVVGNSDQKKSALKRLQNDRKKLQHELGRSVILKHTPILRFSIDESVERGNRILDILHEIEKDIPPE